MKKYYPHYFAEFYFRILRQNISSFENFSNDLKKYLSNPTESIHLLTQSLYPKPKHERRYICLLLFHLNYCTQNLKEAFTYFILAEKIDKSGKKNISTQYREGQESIEAQISSISLMLQGQIKDWRYHLLLAENLIQFNFDSKAIQLLHKVIKACQCDAAYCDLARIYNQMDQFELAERCIKNAIQIDKCASNYQLYGLVLFNNRLYKKSIQAFKNAITLDNKFAQSHFQTLPLLANAFFFDGDFKSAQEMVNRSIVIERQPKLNENAYKVIILLFINAHNYSKAKEVIEFFIKSHSQDDIWVYYLGKIYQLTQDYISAIQKYQLSLHLNQNKKQEQKNKSFFIKYLKYPRQINNRQSSTCLDIAKCYMSIQDYEQALRYAKRAYQATPTSPKPFGVMAIIYIQLGGLQFQALEYCNKMSQMSLMDLNDYENLTRNYYYLNYFDKCIYYGRICKELLTSNIQIPYMIGKSYYMLKEFIYSETQYRNSLRENNYLSYLGLAEIQLNVKYKFLQSLEYSFKALHFLQNIKENKNIRLHSKHVSFYLSQILSQIGFTYCKILQFDKAIQFFFKSLEYSKSNFDAVNFLGELYRNKQLFSQQIALYKTFEQKNPRSAQIFFLMGKYYNHIGNYQSSIQCLQQLLKRSQLFHSQTYQEMGTAYYHLKNYDLSVKNYIMSLQKNQHNIFSYFGLADLYLINQKKQVINLFIDQMKAQYGEQPQFIFMLYIYNRLIGQLIQSSRFYWSVVQSIVKQSQQHTSLNLENCQLVHKLYNYCYLISSNKGMNQVFFAQMLLLSRLLSQYQNIMFTFPQETLDQNGGLFKFFIEVFCKTKECGYQYRKKIYQCLFECILSYTQKEGIVVYRFLVRQKQFEELPLKNIMMIVIVKRLNQINDTCKMLTNFTVQSSQVFNINHKYEIIKNIASIVTFYHSLSCQNFPNFVNQIQNQQQLNKIVHNILKTVYLPQAQYLLIIPTNFLLLTIDRNIKNISKSLKRIIKQYKNAKNKQRLKQQVLKILKSLLSQKHIKGQLIKSIWKNIHYLCAEYDESLQKELYNIFNQFLNNSDYTFQKLGLELSNIIMKEESVHSKIQLPAVPQIPRQVFHQITNDERPDYSDVQQQEIKNQAEKKEGKVNMHLIKQNEIGNHPNGMLPAQNGIQNKQKYNLSSQISLISHSSTDQLPQNSNISLPSSNKNDSSIIDEQRQIQLNQFGKIKKNTYTFDNLNKLFKVFSPFYYVKEIPQLQKEKNQFIASIFFKNTHDIMRYLSKKKINTKYIAKYFIDHQWCQQFVKKKQFSFQMEFGDQTYHNMKKKFINQDLMRKCISESNKIINRIKIDGKQLEREDIKIVHYLWIKGTDEIIKYLLCIANGILQLEQHNIFHMDLQFRNSIKAGDIYKLMDFDWAMVCKKIENAGNRINICFQNTVMIVKTLLSYNLNDAQENADFHNAVGIIFPGLSEIKKEQIKHLCGKQDSVRIVLQILQKYAKQFHRKQFNRLLCFFSVEEIVGKNFKKLKFYLNLLLNGKKSYQETKTDLQRTFKAPQNI